ncbi:class II Aldolase and Adducin domain protein [Teladorsagia circumcincta]|uniref:Class II Aldolase and Adducin domain protein n=1 Tax=Teladorsagia circumcincta TaxID=45464 RepID=A0A2G9V0T7_TELCI|nr:class II Aldolase and Adducin domain protein [Teladorsagia circumcincta]
MTAKGVSLKNEKERPSCFDPDDPDYVKDLQRPAVIKVIRQDSNSARGDSEQLKSLKRLSELKMHAGAKSLKTLPSVGASAVPIADLKSNDNYSVHEKMQRNKLASLFRLVDLFQWSLGIHNNITLRLRNDDNCVLINSFGLLYHEITAGSLVKLNLQGVIVDPGTTSLGINKSGFMLHSAIHSARPDVRCILHLNTAVVSAVASMTCGLLPLCQEAISIGSVAYHDNNVG